MDRAPGTGRPAICGEVPQADSLHRVSRISSTGLGSTSAAPPAVNSALAERGTHQAKGDG